MVPEKQELTRKQVLYIGSAVPTDTAEGLEAVQKPLSERYPADDDSSVEGILAELAVLPAGLTLQYRSDPSRVLFFPVSSLTLCAAVRCVSTVNAATGETTARFASLSSPLAGGLNGKRPAIFTAITRRSEGRRVLECHGFLCSSSRDALELVQCTARADRARKGRAPHGGRGSAGLLPAAGSSFHLEPSTVLRGSGARAGFVPAPAGGPSDGVHVVKGSPEDQPDPEAAGEPLAPEFYEPPPEHGYFYKTKDSEVKAYSVERVVDGESEWLRAVPPHHPHTLPRPAPPTPPAPAPERRVFYPGPPPPAAAAAAASMTLPHPPPHHPHPHPQGRVVYPVRGAHPVPGAPFIRPRFFSPPPPMLRPRPVAMGPQPHVMARDPYIFLPPPPPPNVHDGPYGGGSRRRAQRRRGSDSSSRGSSASSSPDSPRELNGRRRLVNGHHGGDGSSDVSSRPRTPPTDYDQGPRVSRRDHFERRQRYAREVVAGPGNYSTLPTGAPPLTHAYDYYAYPQHYPHAGYPYVMDRARSMPPPARRAGRSKERKKGRKERKKEKASKRRGYGIPSDVSTDSVGYTSEAGPTGDYPRMPRDFRRVENQFKHERAFSKSLSEEFRGGPGENPGNAYSLNEHMAYRGMGDADFSLY